MKKLRGFTVNKTLILFILLALVIRVVVVLSRQAINGDEFGYSRLAEHLANGSGYIDILGNVNTIFSPLLPLLSGGMSFILNDIVASGYVVEVLFGCLLLIPAFLLAKEFAGEKAGLYTAALLAVLPIAVEYSTRIYTEGVYTFFLLMAIFFYWRSIHGGALAYAPLAGGMIGLAYLANPSGLFYVVAFLLIFGITAAMARGLRTHYLKAALLFLAVFIVLATPYVIFLHSSLGKWTYSGKSSAGLDLEAAAKDIRWFTPEYEKMIMSLSDDGTEIVDLSQAEDVDPLSYFARNPKTFVKIFTRDLNIFYMEEFPNVIPLWLLPLLGLGLFGAAWDRKRAKAVGFSLLLMAPSVLIFAIEYRPRFFVPFVPLAMIWVAVGWLWLEEWGRKTVSLTVGESRRDYAVRGIPVVIAISVLLPLLMLTAMYTSRQGYNVELKKAGEWLKDNGGGSANVMDRELNSAFYSGGTAVLFPYAGYEDTTDYARLKDVDYLVISRKDIMDFRPGMQVLLENESLHPDWRLIHGGQAAGDNEVLVFELEK
ncbi:MAG: glycosyltransferase family 39 protein [Thermoleophilia bacterium]